MPTNDESGRPQSTQHVVESLRQASGSSEFVICTFLDIRDFTPFSKVVESPDVAVFLKRVFCRMLDVYFREARYCKLLGDGLLVIVPYTEESLPAVASEVVQACFQLLKDFPTFCAGDPMIHFPVPQRLGIGIARGTACRIESGGQVLDYCGRVVNLAARLMTLAHPSGIVLAGDFALHALLPKELAQRFREGSAHLRGITTDNRPVRVYYTGDLVAPSAPSGSGPATPEFELREPDDLDREIERRRPWRPKFGSVLRRKAQCSAAQRGSSSRL